MVRLSRSRVSSQHLKNLEVMWYPSLHQVQVPCKADGRIVLSNIILIHVHYCAIIKIIMFIVQVPLRDTSESK